MNQKQDPDDADMTISSNGETVEPKRHKEEQFDEGIEETFPASDPVAVEVRKYAPGDRGLTDEGGASRDEDAIDGLAEITSEVAGDASPQVEGIADKVSRVTDHRMRLVVAGLLGCGAALIAYEMLSKHRATGRTAAL